MLLFTCRLDLDDTKPITILLLLFDFEYHAHFDVYDHAKMHTDDGSAQKIDTHRDKEQRVIYYRYYEKG